MDQSFEDFFNSLSPEDQRKFLEAYVLPFTNEPRTLLKRTVLKLSRDLSETEVRLAIAEATGMPVEKVPPLNFENAKARTRSEFEKLEELIGEYKSKLDKSSNVQPDKYDELYDLGRFILAVSEKFRIVVPDEIPKFPDFVISLEDQNIGIEHTRLMSEQIKAIQKTVKYFIESAEKLIANDLNPLCKTVNIFIDYNANVTSGKNFNNRKFSVEERKKIIQTISDYIKSELTGGNISKPEFISQIKITSNQDNRTDLELAEAYFTLTDFQQLLIERINLKEAKANRYRSANDSNPLWLLIVVDDVNSFSGFDLQTEKIPQITNSKFDCIILFEKFGGNVHIVFQKKS